MELLQNRFFRSVCGVICQDRKLERGPFPLVSASGWILKSRPEGDRSLNINLAICRICRLSPRGEEGIRGKHYFARTVESFPARILLGTWVLIFAGGLMNRIFADAGILFTPRDHLRLFQKIAQPENLLDNPAYFCYLPKAGVETHSEWDRNRDDPADPVFEKSAWEERRLNSTQAWTSAPNLMAVNLGFLYQHRMTGNRSVSSLDGSFIEDQDKSFLRAWNGGIAVPLVADWVAGYAFCYAAGENSFDFASDLANPYAYANQKVNLLHRLGLIWAKAWDAFAEVESEHYTAGYNGHQEIDFESLRYALNLRRVWGKPEQAKFSVLVNFTGNQLSQKQFAAAREHYQLDLPDSSAALYAYWHAPQILGAFVDGGVGMEGVFQNRLCFSEDAGLWQKYQAGRLALPVMLWARLLPGMRVWGELSLVAECDTLAGTQNYRLENSFGVQLDFWGIEADLNAVPQAEWISASQAAGKQRVALNGTVKVYF